MNLNRTVFFITVIDSKEFKNRRCWGFFFNGKEAEYAVLHDLGDMFEAGSYDQAVIEELPEGITAQAVSEKWFKATYRKTETAWVHDVEPIEKPAQYVRVVNFGIG